MESYASISEMLLDMIAKNRPELFIPHLTELKKALIEEENDRICQMVLSALSAAALCKPDETLKDRLVHGPILELSR